LKRLRVRSLKGGRLKTSHLVNNSMSLAKNYLWRVTSSTLRRKKLRIFLKTWKKFPPTANGNLIALKSMEDALLRFKAFPNKIQMKKTKAISQFHLIKIAFMILLHQERSQPVGLLNKSLHFPHKILKNLTNNSNIPELTANLIMPTKKSPLNVSTI
jgi:hypothetical protein